MTNLRFYRYEDRADLLAGRDIPPGLEANHCRSPESAPCYPACSTGWGPVTAAPVVQVRTPHQAQATRAAISTITPRLGETMAYGYTRSMPSFVPVHAWRCFRGRRLLYQHGEQVTCFIPYTQVGSAQNDATPSGCAIMYLSAITNNVSNATVTVDLTQGYMTNPVTSITWSSAAGGTAQILFANGHNYKTGSVIPAVIAGASLAGYNNANAVCTVASTTTITYPLATNPGGASSAGTFASHGRPDGEKVVLRMSGTANNDTPQGMVQIDRRVATVTNVTPSTFTTGLSTVGYTAFTVGHAVNNMTLDVGGRGPRPVVRIDGNSPVLMYYGQVF